MDFDSRGLEELLRNFKGLAHDYENFLEDFLTKQGLDCVAETKKRTPVDTGRLRNSWQCSKMFKKGNERYVVVGTDKHSLTDDETIRAANGEKFTNKVIANNVYYASWVEDGHKTVNGGWVKGVHMARNALNVIENKMPGRFQKDFEKWCKGKGIG